MWYCLLCCTRWFFLLSLDETLVCDHSNESYCAVLSCGTVYYAGQGGFNFCPWVKHGRVPIQMKVFKQYFHEVMFFFLQYT